MACVSSPVVRDAVSPPLAVPILLSVPAALNPGIAGGCVFIIRRCKAGLHRAD
jgi:hypothetical protein